MTTNQIKSAWMGAALATDQHWIHHFTATEIEELESAYESLAQGGVIDLAKTTRENFPLPTLGPVLRSQGDEIESGRGFAFLRGLPVGGWDLSKSRAIYWGISLYLGTPISQNARGEKLLAVTDVGVSPDNKIFRGNQGRGDLNFHSDFADVVGLMCIRHAKAGGVSRVCSSNTILLRMQAERPDLLNALRNGFHFYRKGEQAINEDSVSRTKLPMLQSLRNGEFNLLFWPHFAKLGNEMKGIPLTQAEQDAFAYINRVAREDGVYLDAHFQPGDLQFLNNYKLLHSRTDYEDWPESNRKRYLERIWIRTRDDRHWPEGWADLYGKDSLAHGIPALPQDVIDARARGDGIALV